MVISSTTQKPSFGVHANKSQLSLPLSPCSTRFPIARPGSDNRRMVSVNCSQDKDKDKALSVVPLDQRWMFEQSEVDGPVSPFLSLTFSVSVYIVQVRVSS